MERFDPSRSDAFGHAGTFNNNVLSMSAGIAGLRDVLTPEASKRLNDGGNDPRERLKRTLDARGVPGTVTGYRSEEHTSELQSLMRISYAVFCLKKHTHTKRNKT